MNLNVGFNLAVAQFSQPLSHTGSQEALIYITYKVLRSKNENRTEQNRTEQKQTEAQRLLAIYQA
jgi:hypothetical protein